MKPPALIGHRGAAGHAPENTLDSIAMAARMGVRWVEFDVMLSADGSPLLIHDETLERTTDASGRVDETDWPTLRRFDAGSWFSEDWAGVSVPLLSDVFPALERLGLGAVIEIKPSAGRDEETARLTAEMVCEHWPASLPTPILSSFSVPALRTAREVAPNIPRALNIWLSFRGWRRTMAELDCVAMHCYHEVLNKRRATAIIEAGYDLRCFTVNSPKRARHLFRWGVQGIFTDFPERFPPAYLRTTALPGM